MGLGKKTGEKDKMEEGKSLQHLTHALLKVAGHDPLPSRSESPVTAPKCIFFRP